MNDGLRKLWEQHMGSEAKGLSFGRFLELLECCESLDLVPGLAAVEIAKKLCKHWRIENEENQ